MTTQPSNAALAAAFREALLAEQEDSPTASLVYAKLAAIRIRARELDAAKGGELPLSCMVCGQAAPGSWTSGSGPFCRCRTTTPTQPGDAGEGDS